MEFLNNFTMVDFNYFDVTIGAIIIILGIKGFVNGFIKEIFGLAGLVGGVYFGSRLSEKAAEYIEANFLQIDNIALLKLLGFLAILIVVWLGATIVGLVISKLTSASGLGFINRLLGFITGGGKYFIIFALIITALSNVVLIKDKLKKYTDNSQLYPYLEATGTYLIHLDPKQLGINAEPIAKMTDTNATDTNTTVSQPENNSSAVAQ